MAIRLTATRLVVIIMSTSGCAAGPPSGTAHSSSVAHEDLSAVVYSPDAPPSGMTSDGSRDGQVLGRLPLSTSRSAALQAHPGFVNGRYATFSGSSGFLLSWAAQYASDEDAAGAGAIIFSPMTATAGVSENPPTLATRARVSRETIPWREDCTKPSACGETLRSSSWLAAIQPRRRCSPSRNRWTRARTRLFLEVARGRRRPT